MDESLFKPEANWLKEGGQEDDWTRVMMQVLSLTV